MDTLIVSTTRSCRNTPRVLFALEEAGAPYEVHVKRDGWFEGEHGRAGPMLEEGALRLFEVNAILRYVARTRGALWPADPAGRAMVDMWMDFSLATLRPALLHVIRQPDADTRRGLAAVLGFLDRALGERPWLLGEPTIADLAYATLNRLPGIDAMTADLPRFRAWQARLHERPAFARATRRVAGLAEVAA